MGGDNLTFCFLETFACLFPFPSLIYLFSFNSPDNQSRDQQAAAPAHPAIVFPGVQPPVKGLFLGQLWLAKPLV